MTTDLDTLERLEREATPGPWRQREADDGDLSADSIVEQPGNMLTSCDSTRDAALIAASRNALPALLRVARAAEEVLAWAEEVVAAADECVRLSGGAIVPLDTAPVPRLRAALAGLEGK